MTVSGLASQWVSKKVFTLNGIEAFSENVLTSEAIEASRSFFRGRRQWPQAIQMCNFECGACATVRAVPAVYVVYVVWDVHGVCIHLLGVV